MLERFHIQSFKVIGELDIALEQLTVLVGPNACGKSSVLQAMHALCEMRERNPAQDRAVPFRIQRPGGWRETPLDVLRRRGECCGLESFLDEVRERLVPLFAPPPRQR